MIDFAPIRDRSLSIIDLAAAFGPDDLRRETDEMIDAMQGLIADCVDADVIFVPNDPEAYDSAAATTDEVHLSWTLGHVIVHVTASAEESAYLAVELARGVRYRRLRSRYEVPWQTVTTIEQCRHRLEESRRMRLASLELWPDQPYLDNTRRRTRDLSLNAVAQFLLGLKHDDDHLDQIENIVRQAGEGA